MSEIAACKLCSLLQTPCTLRLSGSLAAREHNGERVGSHAYGSVIAAYHLMLTVGFTTSCPVDDVENNESHCC